VIEQIGAQWPLLGVMVLFSAALLRIVQSQYERMLADRDKRIESLEARIARLNDLAEAVQDLVTALREPPRSHHASPRGDYGRPE
jgi:hypothetical protein